MSDIIRVSFTVEEADILIHHLSGHGVDAPVCRKGCVLWPMVEKLRKAAENPLNGPTFDYSREHAEAEESENAARAVREQER